VKRRTLFFIVVAALTIGYYLFVDMKRLVLWRVRRKLTLSYIFIAFVPAALIISFFLLAGYLTLWLAKTIKLPASLAGSVLFYVVTNAFAWLSDPGYTKNFAGLIQALTVGLAQYSATPSWMFFRNSVLSDLLFTGLFILCMHWGRATDSARATAALPRAI